MNVTIVIPIFNDWESFSHLLLQLDNLLSSQSELRTINLNILGVDDGSKNPFSPEKHIWPLLKIINRVEIIHLAVNLGHQRAIAVGLCQAAEYQDTEVVVIMDSDGEDSPEDALKLMRLSRESPEKILVGRRGKRSESFGFRAGYFFYKLSFRTLTGISLPFGNFMLLPKNALNLLIYDSNIWNHIAAAINKSKFPRIEVQVDRGMRFFGKSHMNFTSLVIHGLSAMSVFSDRIAIRLIFTFTIVTTNLLIGILVAVSIRIFTPYAIPGWASQVVGTLCLGLFFSLGFSALLAFITLQARQGVSFIPKFDSPKYIRNTEKCYEKIHPNT